MSRTALEAVEIVYQHLKQSTLFTDEKKPNGNLYRLERPEGSGLEDVVVNDLAMDRRDVQRGILNVNLFVPNLKLTLGGNTNNQMPNTKRLLELSQLANSVLKQVWGAGYSFNVQQDKVFEDTGNQHYINFRIEFYSVNI